MPAAARAASRAALGLPEDEIVFLNVGAPLWNKGADQLLRAFAVLRLRGLPVRLLVKDQRGVYGLSIETMLHNLGQSHPELLSERVLSGITTIPGNLAPPTLSALFGVADAYVSPYRAEGFNLPVLEAIACGLPAVVTRGGATDDFCTDDTALRIGGRFCRKEDETGLIGAYIEPDFDELVAAMASVAAGWTLPPGAGAAREKTLDRFNWKRAAQQTLRLAFDGAQRGGLCQ
jgi:glycosyltransferase involved in cell wall biosynthesis